MLGFRPLGSLPLAAATSAIARTLVADKGAYAQIGYGIDLRHARRLAADKGAYTLIGPDASLRATRQLALAKGNYTLTGYSALLRLDRSMAPEVGAYALTGNDVDFLRGIAFNTGAGSYEVTPGVTTLTHEYTLSAGDVRYSWSPYQAMMFKSSFFYGDPEIIRVPWECSSVIVPSENRTITLVAVEPVEELFEDRTLDAEARLRATN